MPDLESALVVFVPEAEALVHSFRDLHDPSAAAGVPAHITVLYPFIPPDQIDAAVLDRLRCFFAEQSRFDFSLSAIGRFESPIAALYLSVEPAERFRQLTLGIWHLYPDWPPYQGKFSNVTPHVTIAQVPEIQQLDDISVRFGMASQGNLPVRAAANAVHLIENRSGRWNTHVSFALGMAR